MLLLDTHALIWLATDLAMLPETARSAIRYHASELHISAITALEVSLLVRYGKLKWGDDPGSALRHALQHHRVREVPVDAELAWASGQLPSIHRDPFDRIIIITAQKYGMTILTKDRMIPSYPKVSAVWE